MSGTGISTRHPSTTPVGLALGPDSPWAEQPGPGTLGLPAPRIPTADIATHACILTRHPSTRGLRPGFTGGGDAPLPNTPPTRPRLDEQAHRVLTRLRRYA